MFTNEHKNALQAAVDNLNKVMDDIRNDCGDSVTIRPWGQYSDDLGYSDIGCFGSEIETPNLDRLHGESLRFTDFHVSPTCAPTRASLLTGRHEFKSGVTHTILERERLSQHAETAASDARRFRGKDRSDLVDPESLGQPLINSALWIIPRMVEGQGLQTMIRRQGKQHLSPMELPFNSPVELVTGFRPCQWLVGYEWSNNPASDALWLTGAICYDATDLRLASDLRDRSDVFAIPALNLDVGTFDQMAQALHYHMYQLVLIANNGAYGGSNAHVPKGGAYERQVFHTHGQPQATISFFEIDNIEDMKGRRLLGAGKQDGWKYPPAGYLR